MKRYKLKIPEMIRLLDLEIANDIIDWNSGVLKSGKLHTEGLIYNVPEDIPKDWLEETKEEPVNAEEYHHKNVSTYKSGCISLTYMNATVKKEIVKAYKTGASDNELRHRPQQSFNEWWVKTANSMVGMTSIEIIAKKGWDARGDTHNWKN